MLPLQQVYGTPSAVHADTSTAGYSSYTPGSVVFMPFVLTTLKPLTSRAYQPSVSHRQLVTALPPGARLLAAAERDPIHAFAVGELAWGVQFHPEFDADIVRGYIDARGSQLADEGLDAGQLKARARDTLHGPLLLHRFAHLLRTER